MRNKQETNAELSNYFKIKAEENKEIPFITEIAKSTGVSAATISRYSRRKGFYNFSEMRATFNRNLTVSKSLAYEHKAFLEIVDYKKVNIVTSKATTVIGQFLKDRLEFLDSEVEVVDSDYKWSADEYTIIISINNDSSKIEDLLSKMKGRRIVVSTRKNEKMPRSITQVILPEYKIDIRNSYEVSNAIVDLIKTINETVNFIQIKLENQKNKI